MMDGTGATVGSSSSSSGKVDDEDLYGACRPVSAYQKINQIGEGTYGMVYRAIDRANGRMVALKRVILHNEKADGFPLTSLREIRMLKKISHPNCVRMLDLAVGRKRDGVFLVFEYCEHDMGALIDHMGKRFTESEVKSLMVQLLSGVEHLHDHWIIHRDIKMSNLLYTNQGLLKLADFGLARLFGAPPKPMTSKVVTLWYRAPELLLGCEAYDTAIDMWAVGCILGELLLYKPLLPGKDEDTQLEKIFELLGSPNVLIWPGVKELPLVASGKVALRPDKYPYNNTHRRMPDLSEQGLDLLNSLLAYDPPKRLTAREAPRHGYFREKPVPKEPGMMPTFPTRHDEMEQRERQAGQSQQSTTSRLLRADLMRGGAPSLAQSLGGTRIAPKKPRVG